MPMLTAMPDPRDHVELSSARQSAERLPHSRSSPRPWLGLHFRCSGRYGRAYRNPEGTAYIGRCPSCGKTVRFVVGEGGTSERMFRVEC
jgi:hypothetical protein